MRQGAQILALATLFGLGLGNGWGQIIDPQISVSGGCGTGLFGGETNGICNGASITIEDHSGKNLSTDLLVILGIPGGGTAPTLTYGHTGYLAGGTPVWGWSGSSAEVTFNALSHGSACAALGLANGAGGCASESFGNWASADAAVNHFTPTSFGIYAYELPVALPSFNSINVGFRSGLPLGSFVIGDGCEHSPSGSHQCKPSGDVGSTPFTVAGLTNTRSISPVPEPASMTLMGIGLVGLAGVIRRRHNKLKKVS